MDKSSINPYENAWNLFKQMTKEYMYDRKYLTKRDVQHIIKTIDRSISVHEKFHGNDEKTPNL